MSLGHLLVSVCVLHRQWPNYWEVKPYINMWMFSLGGCCVSGCERHTLTCLSLSINLFVVMKECAFVQIHVNKIPSFHKLPKRGGCIPKTCINYKLSIIISDYTDNGRQWSTQCAASSVTALTRWMCGNQPPSHKLWSGPGAKTRNALQCLLLCFAQTAKRGWWEILLFIFDFHWV